METFFSIIIIILMILGFLYFGVLLYGVLTGHLDPNCIHYISPPPKHWSHVGKMVTCSQ